MFDYLPEELLILSRLPVKTLLQFRCVSKSKSWNSLITSPNFITKHLTISNKNKGLFLRRPFSCKAKKENYSLHYDNETLSQYMELESCFKSQRRDRFLQVVGSCNGLICLSADDTFIFWNPLIRKSIPLPTPHFTFSTHGNYCHILGFGYDSRTDDYKLVRLVYLEELVAQPTVELYSLRTGTWKTISVGAPDLKVCNNHAFACGAAHWLASRPDLCSVVLAFHMCDEVFREMMLPKSLVGQGTRNKSISEFGESISEINYVKYDCDVWVMKEYNVVESWTRQYTFNLLYNNLSRNPTFLKVLGFRKNGEMLLKIGFGKLALFNPGSKQVKDIGIYVVGSFSKSYVESLVLLDKPNLIGDGERKKRKIGKS